MEVGSGGGGGGGGGEEKPQAMTTSLTQAPPPLFFRQPKACPLLQIENMAATTPHYIILIALCSYFFIT